MNLHPEKKDDYLLLQSALQSSALLAYEPTICILKSNSSFDNFTLTHLLRPGNQMENKYGVLQCLFFLYCPPNLLDCHIQLPQNKCKWKRKRSKLPTFQLWVLQYCIFGTWKLGFPSKFSFCELYILFYLNLHIMIFQRGSNQEDSAHNTSYNLVKMLVFSGSLLVLILHLWSGLMHTAFWVDGFCVTNV